MEWSRSQRKGLNGDAVVRNLDQLRGCFLAFQVGPQRIDRAESF